MRTTADRKYRRHLPRRTLVQVSLLAAALLALTGCGKQAFKVTSSTATQQAPGHYLIQPKVDILLAEDDTGSISEIYTQLSTQMPAFLTGLEAKGWNYHFAVTPLTKRRALNQILASKHDVNWGSQWTSPYPGALPDPLSSIASFAFRTPENFNHFLKRSDVNNSLDGREPGLETIRTALVEEAQGTGFIRGDALLVILVVGNGNDTSGVTYCYRPVDGIVVPCEDTGYPELGTKAASFSYYKEELLSLKSNPAQIKFYSAVAAKSVSNCLGGRSYAGTRYMDMATYLGGKSFDICSQSVSSTLDALSNTLHAEKKSYQTRYLFIDQEPEESSIEVTRYITGEGNRAEVIPNSAENGWTYAGTRPEGFYAIDFPIEMNLTQGYAIELHGSAKIVGYDTADVKFKPKGARDSVEE